MQSPLRVTCQSGSPTSSLACTELGQPGAQTELSNRRQKGRKSNFFHFLAQSYAVNTANSKSNIRTALTQEKAKEKENPQQNPKSRK